MEQTQQEICDDMDLSETQFRLLKSRAKARFGELVRASSLRRTVFDKRAEGETARSKSFDREVEHIVPVVAHALAVFGDEIKASHWLSTPLALLADRTPSQVLKGQGGIEAVERMLTRIEHNIPS